MMVCMVTPGEDKIDIIVAPLKLFSDSSNTLSASIAALLSGSGCWKHALCEVIMCNIEVYETSAQDVITQLLYGNYLSINN